MNSGEIQEASIDEFDAASECDEDCIDFIYIYEVLSALDEYDKNKNFDIAKN